MQNRTDSERIAAIEAIVTRMDKQLFGNGQPGEINILHAGLIAMDKRIDTLDNWRWWVIGAATVTGTILGYVLR